MEQHKQIDNDSDVIICEDIPEKISVSTSPEKIKKPKAKKPKRIVKKGVNFNNNTETLLITQKLKGKKTKFKCIINTNTMCEKRSASIVRFHTNVCKKEAYYHRIVPTCLRKMCCGSSYSCCRSTIRDYNKCLHPKAGSFSPVSSIPLNEAFPCNNISYEDISNGSFSVTSEDELDSLIKRTRQREKQIDPARKYFTSTPVFQDVNMASPFSIDTIHSDNTMILNPLPTGEYSPTSSDVIKIDNMEIDEATNMIDIDVPYSPTMTPDFKKIENLDYSPVDKTSVDDNIPYSPTYTPEFNDLEINSTIDSDQPYSLTVNPTIIEMDNFENTNIDDYDPYSPTMTPENNIENPNNYIDKDNKNQTVNVGYSPRSPTVTPDYHKCFMTQTNNWNDFTVPYSLTASGMIKQENSDDESTIIRNTFAPKCPDLIKKESKSPRSF